MLLVAVVGWSCSSETVQRQRPHEPETDQSEISEVLKDTTMTISNSEPVQSTEGRMFKGPQYMTHIGSKLVS